MIIKDDEIFCEEKEMSTLLYIKANAKEDKNSTSITIAEHFIKEYKNRNPKDNIVTLDLKEEPIGFLTEEDLKVIFGNEKEIDHPILEYAKQFAQADKYVIAEPMWNLSIPAILKAYIDYICVPGITFEFTENGTKGLLYGRKAINISSRGGLYPMEMGPRVEMGNSYIRKVLALFGIVKYETLYLENIDNKKYDAKILLQQALEDAGRRAQTF